MRSGETFSASRTPPVARRQRPGSSRHLAPRLPQTRSRQRYVTWLFIATALYLTLLLAISLANLSGPEQWWWATVNLYVPQSLWGIPALALFLATLRVNRLGAVAQLIPLLWVVGPLMGYNLPSSRNVSAASAVAGEGRPLRVMTYNIEWGRQMPLPLVREINAWGPDIVVMQDARSDAVSRVLQTVFHDWHIADFNEYTVISRYPLSQVAVPPLPMPSKRPSDRMPRYLRCVVQVGKTPVTLYSAHLITPRRSLNALRKLQPDAISEIEINTADRLYQAAALVEALRQESGPVLVVGDFNAPPASLVCRRLTDIGLTNAFSEIGRGYGFTFGHSSPVRHSFLRIDHILVSPHWWIRACRTGGARASDHRPLIADLTLLSSTDGKYSSPPGVPARR
jgi:vancomycin resistance protein VanJ